MRCLHMNLQLVKTDKAAFDFFEGTKHEVACRRSGLQRKQTRDQPFNYAELRGRGSVD